MTEYVISRLVQAAIVAVGVTLIVFGFLHLSGDPVLLLVPSDASVETIAQVRRQLGLDRPLWEQYLRFLAGAVRGDFGDSLRMNRPALGLVFERLPNTLLLTLVALGISLAVSLPIGIISAVKRATIWDHVAMLFALVGQAIPVFWLGVMLILVFSVQLAILPVQGADTIWHLVLPAISLSTVVMGRNARLVRSSMLEVLNQDYIRTAKAKGLKQRVVLTRHALKNASIPIVTLLGLQFAQLLGGAVVTETIFAWPGVGRLVVEAIFNRDFPVVQAVVFVVSMAFVIVNLFVDLSYAWLDPRIRVR
ncbi:MAG: ABC transporter permease [Chloroflexi bacterium]|nr:ABC transporter permease [Chloroflexota bacterium]